MHACTATVCLCFVICHYIIESDDDDVHICTEAVMYTSRLE